MRNTWIILVLLGILIIAFPEIIAYIIGGLFLFIWLNILFFSLNLSKNSNTSNRDNDGAFIKIWKYKIYK
jgi:cytochrome bd-type quinol oxidase subunit 2